MIKVFVWDSANDATNHYHSQAGIVVFATTLKEARKKLKKQVPNYCDAFTTDPDSVFTLNEIPQNRDVMIFEDAGCC